MHVVLSGHFPFGSEADVPPPPTAAPPSAAPPSDTGAAQGGVGSGAPPAAPPDALRPDELAFEELAEAVEEAQAETVAVGGSCIDELTMLLATVFMVQLVKSNAVGYLKERGAKKDPVSSDALVSAETRLVVGKRPKAKRLGLVTGG